MAGSYALQVTLDDDGGSTATANGAGSSNTTISLVEGQATSVALLVMPAGGTQLSSDINYTVSVDWGDGSPPSDATAELADDGTQLRVSGVHVFTEEGTYTVTASVADEAGTLSTATMNILRTCSFH